MPAAGNPTPEGPSQNRANWEAAKGCLAELHREAPSLLQQAVLIGGMACWFYRHLLATARDPDFKVGELSPEQERLWLSKDIDFTNFFAPDARGLLRNHVVADEAGRLHLIVADIPIGFAQVGLTFDPESAWAESWIGNFTWGGSRVQCRVLHPISLYREKLALSQRRGFESDRLHCAVLAEFLRLETCRQAESLAKAPGLEERTSALKFLFGIRDRTFEICRDQRVRRRLGQCGSAKTALTPAEANLLDALTREEPVL
jgi:hypothetical protein